jgi:integrase
MTLFKRGTIWWAYFTMDGVRHQESTGTTNRRLAERILRDLEEQANLKRHRIKEFDREITLQEVAERFIASDSKPFNLDRLKHLLPFFGPLRIFELTKNKATEYRAVRRSVDPALKDATLNKDLGVLRHILYWAVNEELIAANPLARVPMMRERRIPIPILTLSEETKLLSLARPHLKPVVMAALDTGMRKGELLKQRWDDVDLTRKVLFVSQAKTPEGDAREIPFTNRLFGVLAATERQSEYIFSYRGNPILDIKTSWNTLQRKAGLTRHYRFHDLRHCFNVRLMEAGVIADVRKALMGHVDPGVHGIYTHVELPAKREAIAKLERWIDCEKQRMKISTTKNP